MKYKKNKVKRDSLSDAGFLLFWSILFHYYLYVKGLYIKVFVYYRKKIVFDFIEKKYVQFITWIFLLKSMYLLKF